MVNKKKYYNNYCFVDYNKNTTMFAIVLPIIILVMSMLMNWLLDRKINLFVRVIPIIFALVLLIVYSIMLYKSHYKVIGTDEKLYILKGIKYDIIKLSDIQKKMYTLNSRGYFDCNIIANGKMYDLKIYKRQEYIDYLNMHCKKCSREESVSQCIISDRKIVYSSFIMYLLFIITLNIFPIVFLIIKIIANDYYWYVDKIMSLSWVFLISMLPAILLICFASIWKKALLEVKKYFIAAALVVSISLLTFSISMFLQRTSVVSYESDAIESIENKTSYQFPQSALCESRFVGTVKEIVVTLMDKDEFVAKLSEIKENSDFIKHNSSGFPNDVVTIISAKEIDYCFVYSTKGLKENEIDYYKYDEYIIFLIDSDNYRFFIYDFSQ